MAGRFDIQVRLETKLKKTARLGIKNVAGKILSALGWKKAALSILIVDDKAIRKINKQYLRHDYATDVIAFSHLEGRKLKSPAMPLLGDIVISAETAERQAAVYGNTFGYELVFYLCHGILHVLGHDDKTPKLAKAMENKQKQILKKIGIKNS